MRKSGNYEAPTGYWDNIASLDQQIRGHAAYSDLAQHTTLVKWLTPFRDVHCKAAWTGGDESDSFAIWRHNRTTCRICPSGLYAASSKLAVVDPGESYEVTPSGNYISFNLMDYEYTNLPFGMLRGRLRLWGVVAPLVEHEESAINPRAIRSDAAYQGMGVSLPHETDYELLISQLERGASGLYDRNDEWQTIKPR